MKSPARPDAGSPLEAVVALPMGPRDGKPRLRGLTMVIDKGLGLAQTRDLMEVAGDYIDFVKLAFGTALLYPPALLAEKVRIIRSAGVEVYPGGTLLEAAVHQGAAREFLAAAAQAGFTAIEVSEGTIDLAPAVRRDLIRRAVDMGFRVLTEVGKKDPARPLVPEQVWEQVAADRAQGAFKVVIEGRDAGHSVGIYDEAGAIRESLFTALVAGLDCLDDILWEAPRTSQQQALLLRLGPGANFGNVQPQDVVTLEALRVGLRGDTLRQCAAGGASPAAGWRATAREQGPISGPRAGTWGAGGKSVARTKEFLGSCGKGNRCTGDCRKPTAGKPTGTGEGGTAGAPVQGQPEIARRREVQAMGTVAATGQVRLEAPSVEAREAEVQEKFLRLLATDRSSPEFLQLYREVDAALEELVGQEETVDR